MEGGKMNPIVRALLAAVAVFAICFGIGYARSAVVGAGAFEPNWFEYGFLAVVAGVLTYVGPDAAQRRRNRQDLKDKLAGKR